MSELQSVPNSNAKQTKLLHNLSGGPKTQLSPPVAPPKVGSKQKQSRKVPWAWPAQACPLSPFHLRRPLDTTAACGFESRATSFAKLHCFRLWAQRQTGPTAREAPQSLSLSRSVRLGRATRVLFRDACAARTNCVLGPNHYLQRSKKRQFRRCFLPAMLG